MKKFFKLLCYSLITVFLLEFGGEKVSAEPSSFKINQGDKWVDISSTVGYNWWSNIKTIDGGTYNGKYVFCLDSHKHVFTEGNVKLYTGNPMNLASTTPYNTGYKDYAARILMKAYSLGLGNGQTKHNFTIGNTEITGFDEKDLYGVTQSAIWHAAHKDSSDDGVGNYSKTFLKGDKLEVYNYLIENDTTNYYLTVSTNDNVTMTADGDFLVSTGEYTIDTNIETTSFIVNVNGGQMKINDGEWTNAVSNVRKGDRIKLRASKPQSGEVSVTLNVASGEFVDYYNVYLYEADTTDNNQRLRSQNIVFPIEHKTTKTASVTIVGNYTESGTVKTRKIDADTGEPVPRARLQLVRKSSADSSTIEYSIPSYTTIYEENNPEGWKEYSNLKPGYYCLKEVDAPGGYIKNNTDDTDDSDGIVSCGELTDGGTLELVKVNKMKRVKYKKVDTNGKAVAGVRLEIHNYVEEWSNSATPYLCGISDAQGYLTIPCEGAQDNPKIISPDENGTFPLGWKIGKDGNNNQVIEVETGAIYYVKETFKTGYYTPQLDDEIMDFGFGYAGDEYRFQFSGPANPNVVDEKYQYPYRLANDGGIDADEYLVEIDNDRYINISKQDTGTGKEVKGAQMLLCDLSSADYSIASGLDLSSNQVPYSCVDSWISDGTDHTFVGVVPGHVYSLTEVVSPDKYHKLETEIKFTVSEDGKVELVDATQYVKDHAGIPDKSSYYLIIKNDLLVDTPSTGVSILNKVAIGGLLVFVGYEIIKFRKMKANS